MDIHLDPMLHAACGVDLVKFCHNKEHDNGGLFACLAEINQHHTFSLEPECKSLMSKRMEMLNLAVQVRMDEFKWHFDIIIGLGCPTWECPGYLPWCG